MTEKDAAPEEKETALQKVDKLLLQEQHAHAVKRAGTEELKWFFRVLFLLLLPLGVSPYLWPPETAFVICLYVAITGCVVSAWALLRALRTVGKKTFRGAGIAYAICFLVIFLFYVAAARSPNVGRKWTWIWMKTNPSLRKK